MMETDEEKTLCKPHAEDKLGSLVRKRAIRRKGTIWNQTVSRLNKEKKESIKAKSEEAPREEREWRKSKGSSLDLASTLLNTDDNIAAATSNAEPRIMDQTEAKSKSLSLPVLVTVRPCAVFSADNKAELGNTECNMDKKHTWSKDDCVDSDMAVNNPDCSREKMIMFSSHSTTTESSSPSDSSVMSMSKMGKMGGSQKKSPPTSLLGGPGTTSLSSQCKVPPASPKSPTHECKDTRSPSDNKGSMDVSYVQRVTAEIVDTERIYVKSLEDIIQGYLKFLEKSTMVKQEDIHCLFSNIRDIFVFGRHFLWELEQCDGDPVKVAECFVTNSNGFGIYADYCTNYPSAVEVLTRYMMDPNLSEMLKERQHVLGHGLPIGAYLLRPVQRILKYHLLLQNILKFFDKDKDGCEMMNKAFKHMTQMAHHINEMKRKHEHAVRIQEIQSKLEDYGGEDLTHLGELVLEGLFRVYGAKASRQVFLFEHEILISKEEGGMLGCKASIQLANLMLVEVIPNEPLSFHLIPFDNPRAQFTLQARNMEQKRQWCQEIKRLILETYQGKIPDKVKRLVMELGGNHDDDFVNSENLDLRRSHHTAPEYLEKRRGRRKSGGRIPVASRKSPGSYSEPRLWKMSLTTPTHHKLDATWTEQMDIPREHQEPFPGTYHKDIL